jgi:G3E family GTPase
VSRILRELPKIPVIVITGFLGSGKTTLLNRLLADGVKTAVVINEFGATPIDQDLLQNQDIPMTVLAGGCLCCQIKGTLAPTLKNLWMAWDQAETKPFDRMIIEASGVASPEPILDTLCRERWLASRYRLQQVITTLAIPSAIAQLDSFAEARSQVAWADNLLLTHADLADAKQQIALDQCLQSIAPATPRQMAMLGDYRADTQLTQTQPPIRRLPNAELSSEHRFQSISLNLAQALPWPQLEAILKALLVRHPVDLLRIKGVVYLENQAEPVVIQSAANRLYPPIALPARPSDDGRGRLVFIVNGDISMLAEDLKQGFGSYISDNAIRIHD